MGRRITDLADGAFTEAFEGVQRWMYRLETRQQYAVDYERDLYEAFLTGAEVQREPGPHQAMIRRHRAAGVHVARVHVLVQPLSEYARFEIAAMYPTNIASGEDIRIIATTVAGWPDAVPRHDYWLLDDQLWVMAYDESGAFVYAEHRDDPGEVAVHQGWRDLALVQSIPLADYLATAHAR